MYSQVTPPPVTPYAASPSPQNSLQNGLPNSLWASGADPRSRYLAEALANLRDQAKTIRTPMALASDLLAEALLQRRYGRSMQDAAAPPAPPALQTVQTPAGMTPGRAQKPGGAPAYAPQGQPGPLQVAPIPQATPVPSPSPGVPPPSAPGGTASAAPAASSPAAGAAVAPPSADGPSDPTLAPQAAQGGAHGASPTLVDVLRAYFAHDVLPALGAQALQARTPAAKVEDQDPGARDAP